jgi:hypothetical protein
MARKVDVQKPLTLDAARTLKALTQQVETLQKLKGRQYQEAEPEETEWTHFTQSYLEAVFGNPSPTLERFYLAGSAGGFSLGGTSPQQHQSKFETRVREYEALLQSLIAVARLQLPEEEIKGVYEPGDQYGFNRDLSSLIVTTTREIFIVDAYLDEDVFNLYVSKVPASAMVHILSNRIGPHVETVARMYAKSRRLELRSSKDIHDRAVFLDQRGWMIGQSIKDAARSKPTYIIELGEPPLTANRDIYNRIWATAAAVI